MSDQDAVLLQDQAWGEALLTQNFSLMPETLEKLKIYAELLRKWQHKINLVGPSTIPFLWRRHFVDSAQLVAYMPKTPGVIVDIGSGAGFPGMVLALLTGNRAHLIDSDTRKSLFLREVKRETGANVEIHNRRIEEITPLEGDILTSRALARLDALLDLGRPHIKEKGMCLLLKGRQGPEELTQAQKRWKMDATWRQSLSDESGLVLKLENISRR
ncbi:16S rRNA (guanine(527)-N(7))-methyltransferase RsmG [Varunaivibrio sulfuroxidans]|uniref:Ribosomal RNA small subunit methyltransferase G n=1 Tax=Varunaivibrio sulfuroxidans TaxID=1773489 RepID=A0A4R3JHM4_9PROT|nr:16S rRNA (guanine(527)-N(7))-methyltransferase RsmG [Varunaivibrio sulfuroxidans]TCS64853.1 16S rRNA m(7)G-527 methyltransferase [Varunaivibrio sulfuroxidans]WES29848.1 16S rRNA (guanine(527)-N(7))-methyltransferase RsmG [Varunaivibrio sulfuroxidans]